MRNVQKPPNSHHLTEYSIVQFCHFGSYRKIPSTSYIHDPSIQYCDLAWTHSPHKLQAQRNANLHCMLFFVLSLYTLNNLQYFCKSTLARGGRLDCSGTSVGQCLRAFWPSPTCLRQNVVSLTRNILLFKYKTQFRHLRQDAVVQGVGPTSTACAIKRKIPYVF